jgi:hypothetical protein
LDAESRIFQIPAHELARFELVDAGGELNRFARAAKMLVARCGMPLA